MTKRKSAVAQAEEFAARLGIRVPILLAPMAGACPVSLSAAVANAGGMGACGALLMKPEEIADMCVFLASPASKMVSGQAISVDGHT